jgi:hypothetical protein
VGAKEITTMRALGHRKFSAALLGSVAALTIAASGADAQPLRRTVDSYFVLAQRKATLKDLTVDGACNVGVNCVPAQGSNACGQLVFADPTIGDGSQTAGNATLFHKPGGRVWQLFRNDSSSLANVQVLSPPVQPLSASPVPFGGAIIDGTCNACVVDVAALQAACGFPSPFPACDQSKPVKALANADCTFGDTIPNNGICDLPPGTYGQIDVQNGAHIKLSPGNYNVCAFKAGRSVLMDATGVTLNVNGGFFKASNGFNIATKCGDLQVFVNGPGQVSFGRNGFIAAKVCAPQSNIKLGHNNILIGNFIGDVVNADLNDQGACCGEQCACFDTFTPSTASKAANTEITASGTCDMTPVKEVDVCGVKATITSKSATEVKFTLGAATPTGSCTVTFVSGAGSFDGKSKLTVTP